MSHFGGRTAIVTGAGGGIGLRIANDLMHQGARVIATDIRLQRPDGLEAQDYVSGDVTDEGVVAAVVDHAVDQSVDGNIDMLVNAAGVAWFAEDGLATPPMLDGSIVEIDPAAWRRVLDINLTGPMLMARATLPVMKRHGRGSMVHIASIAGLRTADGALDAYQVSKAGLISLSRAIAAQHGPSGIRSNTVCPGAVLTPMIAGIYERDPERATSMASRVPLKRIGSPGDIAAAATYLLSDEASFVTGIDLVIDGGWLTNMG
ncbi:SDR family NAD(P)-dependent oxidoreductase [Aeromicrobium sp. P5_D10]